MHHAQEEVLIAARTLWAEARGEPLLGQLAVAYVIVNRWRSPAFKTDHTLAATCLRYKQFSCWNADDNQRDRMVLLSPIFITPFVDVMHDAIHGSKPDPTNGADHYHTTAIRPAWSDHSRSTAVIGNHIFYKLR